MIDNLLYIIFWIIKLLQLQHIQILLNNNWKLLKKFIFKIIKYIYQITGVV